MLHRPRCLGVERWLALPLLLLPSGCMRLSASLRVAPDGSGELILERSASPARWQALSEAAARLLPHLAPATWEDWVNPDRSLEAVGSAVQADGERMGDGEWVGFRARFTFPDVRNLRLELLPRTWRGAPESPEPADARVSFGLPGEGDLTFLEVRFPEAQDTGKPCCGVCGGRLLHTHGAGGETPLERAAGALSDEELGRIRHGLEGLLLSFRVESPDAPGGQVLAEVDFSRLLAQDQSRAGTLALLRLLLEPGGVHTWEGRPGVVLPSQPRVRIPLEEESGQWLGVWAGLAAAGLLALGVFLLKRAF